MIRKSEAFSSIAKCLGIRENEARLWARHLREAGFIAGSPPGHGITPVTEDELLHFVAGLCCCRHAKHAPKYLPLVKTMKLIERSSLDPEDRPLPDFVHEKNAFEALRRVLRDVSEDRCRKWLDGPGQIEVEFGLDAQYVEISGVRLVKNGDKVKQVARFTVLYMNRWEPGEPLPTYHLDDDDLPPGRDLFFAKRFTQDTLYAMNEILMG